MLGSTLQEVQIDFGLYYYYYQEYSLFPNEEGCMLMLLNLSPAVETMKRDTSFYSREIEICKNYADFCVLVCVCF